MKNFEDYKAAMLEQRSPHLREKLLAQAEADGFDAWQLDELSKIQADPWA